VGSVCLNDLQLRSIVLCRGDAPEVALWLFTGCVCFQSGSGVVSGGVSWSLPRTAHGSAVLPAFGLRFTRRSASGGIV